MSRVELRPPKRADAPIIDPWLAEALVAVVGGAADPDPAPGWLAFLRRLTGGQTPLLITRDDRPVGLLVIRAGAAGLVCLEVLAIESGQRNLGLGTEAVMALEARLGDRPLVAFVAPANGLAIYFWLRAGYRPDYPRETNRAAGAGTLMRRDRQTD